MQVQRENGERLKYKYKYSATWHIGEFGILKSEANSPFPICECIGFPDMPSGFVWGEKLPHRKIAKIPRYDKPRYAKLHCTQKMYLSTEVLKYNCT